MCKIGDPPNMAGVPLSALSTPPPNTPKWKGAREGGYGSLKDFTQSKTHWYLPGFSAVFGFDSTGAGWIHFQNRGTREKARLSFGFPSKRVAQAGGERGSRHCLVGRFWIFGGSWKVGACFSQRCAPPSQPPLIWPTSSEATSTLHTWRLVS